MPDPINYQQLHEHIENVDSNSFERTALELFRYQASTNPVYGHFTRLIHCDPEKVKDISQIPFLPISTFKNHLVQTGKWIPERIFLSSGTTMEIKAQHAIRSLDWYHKLSVQSFENIYGPVREYAFLALLPAYTPRTSSSLVEMIGHFIKMGKTEFSGFFLTDYKRLHTQLLRHIDAGQKTILVGVSYALLDFAMKYNTELPDHVFVVETGGMKGRRKEMIRTELHAILKEKFHCNEIYSEYGMTELISQAYTKGTNTFFPSPQMQILIRETTDPRSLCPAGKTGVIQVIDLGNIDTCAFIATDDQGRLESEGTFSVLGRLDASEIRGCNLLAWEQ